MSVFSFALVVFGFLSFVCTCMVIIVAIRSSQTGRYVENQDKLRRVTTLSDSDRTSSEARPVELFDMDLDAEAA